jgi:hypothetical protein
MIWRAVAHVPEESGSQQRKRARHVLQTGSESRAMHGLLSASGANASSHGQFWRNSS